MQLMIQNRGEAPIEAYTLLGMSAARGSQVSGVIGQFGSGAKHAINVLLRAGIGLTVYCGRTRLDFGTKTKTIKDEMGDRQIEQVVCKLSGDRRGTVELGFTTEFGTIDWKEIGMSLREFISNAIDRTLHSGEGYRASIDSGELAVTLVGDGQKRAKEGFTRVFIEASSDVMKYFGDLREKFLHFDSEERASGSILRKSERTPARIYREGVFVREVKGNSLYDYNFSKDQLLIDECRNSSDYTVRLAVAKMLKSADIDTLCELFREINQETSLVGASKLYECGLDSYDLDILSLNRERENLDWQTAFRSTFGDKGVAVTLTATNHYAELLSGKGYDPVFFPSGWYVALKEHGCPVAEKILSGMEQKGHQRVPTTPEAIAAVNFVWNWLVEMNLTCGREKPNVFSFQSTTSGGKDVMGFCSPEGVFLRQDLGDKFLLEVAIEEIIHHVTQSHDKTLDFQNFAVKMLAEMMSVPA